MDKHDCRRNIVLYRLYAVFNEPLFWGPILILSLQQLAHMPLADVYYMESAVLCICVALDLPSGALADIIGRKRTLIIGRIFLLLSAVFFSTMSSPAGAWTGNILWAIGFSFQSGADTSFLYETLKEHRLQKSYARIEGCAIGSRLAVIACCSLVTGFVARTNLRAPLYLCLPFVAIPLVAVFFMKEPGHSERYSMSGQIRTLKDGIAFGIRSKEVRWMVGFAALVGTTSKVWFFTYNPYFEFVHLDLALYGVIFFLLNIVAWVSSHYAYKMEDKLGERGCVLGMILCVGMPILLMGIAPLRPIAFLVLIQNVVRGAMRPFVGNYMHRHVGNNIRATVLSFQSTFGNVMGIWALAVFGFFIGHLGLLATLDILAVSMLVLGGMSYVSYVRRVAVR
ncbi:MAG TPA: MFS transporter [Candidatus Paceibacterota bacterium]|nr:MFS transporter [Candidatus Paceibacterota bacterium]